MKINNNTSEFWDLMNMQNENKLSFSPIYIHKNKIISDWITGKNKKLLNIGIGNGYLETQFLQKKANFKLHGIDISKRTIDILNKNIIGDFKVANITKIPFSDNLFDYIIALDVLEHLSNNELNIGMKEICRIIKRDGTLILSVPINENIFDKKSNRHLIEFNKPKLINLLKKHSFEIIQVSELFAFKKLYLIKTVLSNLLKVNLPNLLIIKAIKL